MKRTTRPPIEQDRVYQRVQSRILQGSLAPGERLSPRLTYVKDLGVSTVTVQRAFDRLIQEGFVEARGALGTFVSEAPPHLCRFALAFPDLLDVSPPNQWYSALIRSSRSIEQATRFRIATYQEVNDHLKSPGLQDLLSDVAGNRLAGVVFVGDPRLSRKSLSSLCSNLPCVALGASPPFSGIRHIIQVKLGSPTSFFQRALDYLLERKCSRVALMAVSGIETDRLEFFQSRAQALGLQTAPRWIHGVEPKTSQWAGSIIRLMFHKDQRTVPDALIISDDNLVEQTCLGLKAAGVRVPDDLNVVAHCNYPLPSPCSLPVARLGYDSLATLTHCVELIGQRCRGKPRSQFLTIDPGFEWELDARNACQAKQKDLTGRH